MATMLRRPRLLAMTSVFNKIYSMHGVTEILHNSMQLPVVCNCLKSIDWFMRIGWILLTMDHDFCRFPGLRWSAPI
jgi:hypothetical protein